MDDSTTPHLLHRVYLAVGSNLGDRHYNLRTGLDLLCQPNYDPDTYRPTRLMTTSFLYHTAPMYVTDQPAFLNGVVQIETNLDPLALLERLKRVERDLGRNFTQICNGPRPLDLDILLYYDHHPSSSSSGSGTGNDSEPTWTPLTVNETEPQQLEVPHPRMAEREFVLAPLVDMAGRDLVHPTILDDATTTSQNGTTPAKSATMGDLLDALLEKHSQESQDDDEPLAARLIPLPLGRYLLFPSPPHSQTLIMGILNVTPDSFSDGGQHNKNVETAVDHALQMVQDGATIIDIGGESTRPGAMEVSVEEQIHRTVPVIEAIRKREHQQQQQQELLHDNGDNIKVQYDARVHGDVPDGKNDEEEERPNNHIDSSSRRMVISIDTRHAAVARAAIDAGADMVNDVSGGTHDPEMLSTVAELGVPIILMHMRGTPATMQNWTDYGGGVDDKKRGQEALVDAVVESLLERSRMATEAGIPRWMQILDVGIGFAKDFDGNLSLLRQYGRIRSATGGFPLLLGTSRKGFLGKITGEAVAAERDYATLGSCVAALCLGKTEKQGDNKIDLGCNILRVHNVRAAKQAALVLDTIVNSAL